MAAGDRSILICDDNVDHLMLMKREVERHGAPSRVVTVTTAAACRQELARQPFDVVVVDYLLRDINGLELLQEITQSHPECVAIMITGMGNEDVAVQAMKSGADDYVIKSSGCFAVVPLVISRALERRALLANRRALADRAEAAARLDALGAVALGVAHDVNQLLAAILGRLTLLAEQPLTDDARRQVTVCDTAARDAADLIGRVLAFGRPPREADGGPVALAGVARDCLEFTRSRWESEARRRGITYQVVCEVPADLAVAAPAASLRAVVTNLVLNSLEAMPEGGTLIVRGAADGERACLRVQDTGAGLSREQQERLFAPGASDKGAGHGIGLTNSRAVVEGLGGRLTVESEPDVGSTFEIALPRGGAARAAASPAPPPAAAGRRVLIVDDELRLAALVHEILTVDAHLPAVAYSGEEAMSKFTPGAWDVVMCDLSLPGMSGLEVAKAVRALDAAVAIVLVTGWGRETEAEGADRAVVDLVAAKPLDVHRIRELVAGAARLTDERRGGAARQP